MAGSNSNNTWSTEEIIKNADNWSLAGDVALLNSLKAFSDNLLTQTVKVNSNIDNLLNTLNDVSLRLDTNKNEFHRLRNTQFVESRVYEDDETLEDSEQKIDKKPLTEEEKDKIIKDSIARGLEVMEKYFERVEVEASDSEEENEKSYILQPKDLYENRPLPFLVGSEEWYKKWHVGLAESSSESESEQVVEEFSESESEDELPKDVVVKGSETSSEYSDYSNKQTQASQEGPAANSTFNEAAKRKKIVTYSSDESEDVNNVPKQMPTSNQSFAEQLAEKLGNVINQQDVPGGINKNITTKVTQNTVTNIGTLLPEEPPPLDEPDDTTLSKTKGVFSGGTGLFDNDDEDEDELFWGQNKSTAKATHDQNKNMNQGEVDRISNFASKQNNNITQNALKSQNAKGLFDSEEESDDDIFTAAQKRTAKQPYLQPFKATVPFFDDQPPELEPERKKEEPQKQKTASEQPKPTTNIPKTESKADQKFEKPDKVPQNPKNTGLFDDTEDMFEENDLFKSIVPKKANTTSNLFDDLEKPDETEKLFDATSSKLKTSLFDDEVKKEENKKDAIAKIRKNISLFDSSSEEEEDLFSTKTASKTGNANQLKKEDRAKNKDAIFKNTDEDNEEQEKNTKTAESASNLRASLFEDSIEEDIFAEFGKNSTAISENSSTKDTLKSEGVKSVMETENAQKQKTTVVHNLFDDDDDNDEDIFEEFLKNKTERQPKSEPKSIEEEKETVKNKESEGADDTKTETSKNASIFNAKISLFDEDDEDHDIFSNMNNVKKREDDKEDKRTEKTRNIFEDKEDFIKENTDDDTRSQQESLIEHKTEETAKNKSLFGEEAPLLKKDNFGEDKEESFSSSFLQKNEDITESKLPIKDDDQHNLRTEDKDVHNITFGSQIDRKNDIVKEEVSTPKEETSSGYGNVPPDMFVTIPTPTAESSTKSVEKRPVNFFDPNPPSDDDWDSKSDSPSELDIGDTYSYTEEFNTQRSSLFDSEPPSLGPNESSGIVRDQHVTRIEAADESSFHPYASSSRRLSSDISAEEHSNDSLFSSKPKQQEHLQPVHQHLQSIPEAPPVDFCDDSQFDITPSGDVNDFVSSDSVFERTEAKTSILESKNTTTEKKTISLFDSDKENSDSENIFAPKKPIASKKPDIVPRKPAQVNTETSKSKRESENIENVKPAVEVKNEEVTEARSSVASIAEQLRNMQSEAPKKEKTVGSPGKLKHNLNINVNALMPGMSAPRIKDLKAQSFESSTDSESSVSIPSMPTPKLMSTESAEEIPVNFQDSHNKVEVLQSITKDRVRIPIQRRPSTRKGRLEALRKSGIDFDDQTEEQSQSSDKTTEDSQRLQHDSNKDTKLTTATSKDISMVFKEQQSSLPLNEPIIISEPTEKPEKTIFSTDSDKTNIFTSPVKKGRLSKQKSLFSDSGDDSDSDLFDIKRNKSKSQKPAEKDIEKSSDSDLFGEKSSRAMNSDESDIFGKGAKPKEKKKDVTKRSLFGDDSSDEDDLFGLTSKKSRNQPGPSAKPIKKPAKTTVKRLDNKEADDDPLTSMLK